MVVRGGVEPPTFRFSGGRSYQLSYLTESGRQITGERPGNRAVLTGFEPATSTLTGWRALQAALQDHVVLLEPRAPNGIRTRAAALKGRCPRPLDDGGSTIVALPVAPAVGDRPSIGDERHCRQSGSRSRNSDSAHALAASPCRPQVPSLLMIFSAIETGAPSPGTTARPPGRSAAPPKQQAETTVEHDARISPDSALDVERRSSPPARRPPPPPCGPRMPADRASCRR